MNSWLLLLVCSSLSYPSIWFLFQKEGLITVITYFRVIEDSIFSYVSDCHYFYLMQVRGNKCQLYCLNSSYSPANITLRLSLNMNPAVAVKQSDRFGTLWPLTLLMCYFAKYHILCLIHVMHCYFL